jgi:hypothetical protein
MKKTYWRNICALALALMAASAGAQSEGWKTYSLDEGKISVKTRITEKLDANGKKVAWIEYESSMTADADHASCLAVLKDVPSQRKWLNASASDAIQAISANEWLVYHRYDAVWPIPSSDCVARASLQEDKSGRVAAYSIVASPDAYESKKLPRFTTFDMRFTLTDLGKGRTRIDSAATISPAIKVPLPLVESGYPGAAADILRKIARLAREGAAK